MGGGWSFFHSSFSPFQDYKPEEDPALFRSVKTGRGPLGPNWQVNYFLILAQAGPGLGQVEAWASGTSGLAMCLHLYLCTDGIVETSALHVCLQTGDCQVPMVGAPGTSGELHPQGWRRWIGWPWVLIGRVGDRRPSFRLQHKGLR